MTGRIHIAIAEPSVIIRSGVASVLENLTALHIDIAEIPDTDIGQLIRRISKYRPDILLINPALPGLPPAQQLKNESGCPGMRCIALQHNLSYGTLLKEYDQSLTIYDTPEQIRDTLAKVIDARPATADSRQELSNREKEIVVCVVKGMTNKQIADRLCLSIHTILTHRKNISSKLQIHSTAGLTIYAIVNKLVELNEIKETLPSDL